MLLAELAGPQAAGHPDSGESGPPEAGCAAAPAGPAERLPSGRWGFLRRLRGIFRRLPRPQGAVHGAQSPDSAARARVGLARYLAGMSVAATGEPRVTCPQCGARVPHDAGYVPWCDCGWNVRPAAAGEPPGPLERAYRELGRRRGRQVFERVKATGTDRSRVTVSRVLLTCFSALVLLTTPALLASAVLLVALTWFNTVALFFGIVFLLLAWVLRPRSYRPQRREVLTQGAQPQLQALVHDVAGRLGAPIPDVLLATNDFNAYVARVGYGRRRCLALGLPLLASLDEQEWVALLGHELGHLANGDERQGRLTGTAMATVAGWCEVLTPTHTAEAGWTFSDAVSTWTMWVVSLVPRGLLQAMVHLAWSESQRAEYHADRLAASVAGTEAACGLEQKVLMADSLAFAAHRVVHRKTHRTVLDEMAHMARSLPPRERERLLLLAEQEEPVLDSTHPPEKLRLRMLTESRHCRPVVELTPQTRVAIDEELAQAAARVNEELETAFRSALHGF